MTSLASALEQLFRFLDESGQAPPTREVRLLEIRTDVATDERGRPRVRRADSRDPEDYEDRFEALLAARPSWINVSCYGVDAAKGVTL